MTEYVQETLSRSAKDELVSRLASAKQRASEEKLKFWTNKVLELEASIVFYGFAEPDSLRKALDKICPDPQSRQVIVHRKQRYRCRYFEVEAEYVGPKDGGGRIRTVWARYWEPIEAVPPQFAKKKK